MKLVYCTREGLATALEYGVGRWGEAADTDGVVVPVTTRHDAAEHFRSLKLEVFEGVICGIDETEDATFVDVVEAGQHREFEAIGDPSLYEVGRKLVVRYELITRMRKPAPDIIDVREMWVGVDSR